jgi:hypothetical protein
MHKILYAFMCPIGAPDSKVGITGHWEVRQGVYQNSYSRNSHVACFDIAYTGPGKAVDRLEGILKQEYNWQIERDGRGASEWLANISPADIEKKIDELIEGYRFKITKVPRRFLPLTVDNKDEFNQYLKETSNGKSKQN